MFGLHMAHKGIVIYCVLWCITAQSDISNGAGCVQVNWKDSRHAQQSERSSSYLAVFLLSHRDGNGFLRG